MCDSVCLRFFFFFFCTSDQLIRGDQGKPGKPGHRETVFLA